MQQDQCQGCAEQPRSSERPSCFDEGRKTIASSSYGAAPWRVPGQLGCWRSACSSAQPLPPGQLLPVVGEHPAPLLPPASRKGESDGARSNPEPELWRCIDLFITTLDRWWIRGSQQLLRLCGSWGSWRLSPCPFLLPGSRSSSQAGSSTKGEGFPPRTPSVSQHQAEGCQAGHGQVHQLGSSLALRADPALSFSP